MQRLILSAPCYNFLEGLITQISYGLRGYEGKIPDYIEVFEGVFAKACLRDDLPLAMRTSPPFTMPNRLLELQRAYLKALHEDRRELGNVSLYPLVDVLPELQKEVGKSRKLYRPLHVKEKHTGLQRAIAMVEDNLGRTCDRIAALRFLDAMWGMHGWPSAEAREGYAAAYAALWRRRSDFYRDLMQLVLVQGDIARIEELRQEIYKRYLSPGSSLMHFLEPDGNHPGRWLSDDEDGFRADLAAAISTPVQVDA